MMEPFGYSEFVYLHHKSSKKNIGEATVFHVN